MPSKFENLTYEGVWRPQNNQSRWAIRRFILHLTDFFKTIKRVIRIAIERNHCQLSKTVDKDGHLATRIKIKGDIEWAGRIKNANKK